jgi:hypothetical protein
MSMPTPTPRSADATGGQPALQPCSTRVPTTVPASMRDASRKVLRNTRLRVCVDARTPAPSAGARCSRAAPRRARCAAPARARSSCGRVSGDVASAEAWRPPNCKALPRMAPPWTVVGAAPRAVLPRRGRHEARAARRGAPRARPRAPWPPLTARADRLRGRRAPGKPCLASPAAARRRAAADGGRGVSAARAGAVGRRRRRGAAPRSGQRRRARRRRLQRRRSSVRRRRRRRALPAGPRSLRGAWPRARRTPPRMCARRRARAGRRRSGAWHRRSATRADRSHQLASHASAARVPLRARRRRAARCWRLRCRWRSRRRRTPATPWSCAAAAARAWPARASPSQRPLAAVSASACTASYPRTEASRVRASRAPPPPRRSTLLSVAVRAPAAAPPPPPPPDNPHAAAMLMQQLRAQHAALQQHMQAVRRRRLPLAQRGARLTRSAVRRRGRSWRERRQRRTTPGCSSSSSSSCSCACPRATPAAAWRHRRATRRRPRPAAARAAAAAARRSGRRCLASQRCIICTCGRSCAA